MLPYFSCRETHNSGNNFNVCQPCFFRWIHGEISSDNIGFRKRIRCDCRERIGHNDIKRVLSPAQFQSYDDALTKIVLEKDFKNVVHCPGLDCMNSFFKPKRTKKRCRKAECNECSTLFCCWCGEIYTKEHQRMKCAAYKKWKIQNDEETRSATYLLFFALTFFILRLEL
jgi:hypothetical protein